jgi:acetolactate synthase-1/2/3 large subunit
MGYDLPASIGACFANGKQELYCITGDGGIQMNLQELQTIVFHQLPIKILIINNAGYHSMRLTQRGLFKEFTTVGVGPESGDLGFPEMSRIAEAYRIPYMSAASNAELPEALKTFLAQDGYAILEVFVDSDQAFEPKPSAMKRADGSLFSPPLEDMAPFLPREELEKIMLIPLVDRES